LFKGVNRGRSRQPFDLHQDTTSVALRRQRSFCFQIGISADRLELNDIRIGSDRPAVLDERVPDCIMNDVALRHSAVYLLLQSQTDIKKSIQSASCLRQPSLSVQEERQ